MNDEGPLLESLAHRLSECPPEFLADPTGSSAESINVAAIICDHFRAIGEPPPKYDSLKPFAATRDAASANRLKVISVAVWLLHDPQLRRLPNIGDRTLALLSEGLDSLSAVVRVETLVSDPDRREELVRICLNHLGLRPRGETPAQATDRLAALNSVERQKILRDTSAAEARARTVREMMAKRAAEEAAAKVSRE